jgi:hypothetical protein
MRKKVEGREKRGNNKIRKRNGRRSKARLGLEGYKNALKTSSRTLYPYLILRKSVHEERNHPLASPIIQRLEKARMI